MNKDYVEIATRFEKALEGIMIDISFERAIRIMKNKPELVCRIPAWDDMVWLCIQEYLNNSPAITSDKEDIFISACALLGEEGGPT